MNFEILQFPKIDALAESFENDNHPGSPAAPKVGMSGPESLANSGANFKEIDYIFV